MNKAIKLVSVRSKTGFGGAGSPRTSHPVVRSHFLVHTAGVLVLNVEFGAEVLMVSVGMWRAVMTAGHTPRTQ